MESESRILEAEFTETPQNASARISLELLV